MEEFIIFIIIFKKQSDLLRKEAKPSQNVELPLTSTEAAFLRKFQYYFFIAMAWSPPLVSQITS